MVAPSPAPCPLTARQSAVLRFLVEFWGRTQRFPSRRELADGVGCSSPNAVVGHLRHLAKKGRVRFGGVGLSRSIEVVGLDSRSASESYLASHDLTPNTPGGA